MKYIFLLCVSLLFLTNITHGRHLRGLDETNGLNRLSFGKSDWLKESRGIYHNLFITQPYACVDEAVALPIYSYKVEKNMQEMKGKEHSIR